MSKNSEKVTRVLWGDPAQDDQPPRVGPDTVDVLSTPYLQHLGDSGPPAGEVVRRQIPAEPDRRVGGTLFVAFSEHLARMGRPPDSGRGSAGPQETCPQAVLRMMFMSESDPGPTRALFRAGGASAECSRQTTHPPLPGTSGAVFWVANDGLCELSLVLIRAPRPMLVSVKQPGRPSPAGRGPGGGAPVAA